MPRIRSYQAAKSAHRASRPRGTEELRRQLGSRAEQVDQGFVGQRPGILNVGGHVTRSTGSSDAYRAASEGFEQRCFAEVTREEAAELSRREVTPRAACALARYTDLTCRFAHWRYAPTACAAEARELCAARPQP